MAIPVEDPPPPYAPPRPTGRAEIPWQPGAGPPPNVRVYRAQVGWRGCLVAIALAFGLLFAFGGMSTCMATDLLTVDQANVVVESTRFAAREAGREEEADEDLRRLSAIITARRLSLVAALVLTNRFNDVTADSHVTDAELDSMMALVHDVVVGDGEIDPAAYPNAR